MANYRISRKAIGDLDRIWIYTFENWSIQQADKYYDLLISEIEFILKNTGTGKSYDHIKEGYKGLILTSHIIFYRIGNDDLIEIVRILHQTMDFDQQL